MKEAFRFYTGLPIGIPHRLTRDDIYEGIEIFALKYHAVAFVTWIAIISGYLIPKGSTVVQNTWYGPI